MKLISWNCQGIGNPETVRAFKRLMQSHKPDINFRMETKKHRTKSSHLCTCSNITNSFFVDCTTSGGGKAGGLGLFWNSDNVHIEIKGFDYNYIYFFCL
jgi:exonuclease III